MSELETRNSRRILLIDDNAAIHDDFQKILFPANVDEGLRAAEVAFFGEVSTSGPDLDIELDSAHQGKEGLEKVTAAIDENRPYAMAFVDMRMPPGWDGLTTIEHLWKVDPDLQIVICTAYSDNTWSDICERLGQTDQLLILKKPFDNVEVCQLALALTRKWSLQHQARMKQHELEALVQQRTTELRERDAVLQQKQKLEAIGSLAGGIAHEFNNLLHCIQGYTRFAREGLESTDQRFEDLGQVLKASDRAASLTSQLLCFSRASNFDPKPVCAKAALEELGHLLKPAIGEKIDVSIIPPENDLAVIADSSGLQQVLLNLCLNARDAMPDGGSLTVSALSVVPASSEIDALPQLQFSVTDTGTGMTAGQVDRIFEPFFTTKEVGKGTGLGLAMVHGFVERHGGEIKVESEPGKGTTFRILLPETEDAVERDSEIDSADLPTGNETILIAEDESAVRAVTSRTLRQAGYHVIEAEDGQQAVRLFEQHRDEIALTLLDVIMPRMTGHEAFEAIRLIEPTAPVVFCTGYDPETSNVNAIRQKRVPLISKPYTTSELLTNVRIELDTATISTAQPLQC